MIKSLNGKWGFRRVGDSAWSSATVPGCNFLDLMDNNVIPDPFIGLNEKEVQWVGDEDWEYKKSFVLTEQELDCDDVFLSCKMLDTICDVYINNDYAFSGDNCFVGYNIPIKKYLKAGENEIRILFRSPVNYVKEKYKECITPQNANGLNGIVHIRKPQCHFGWDWGPVLPCSGITKDIELHFVNGAKIDFLKVRQELKENNTAVITADVDLTVYRDAECIITLETPSGEVMTQKAESAEFVVENPELWWTYELSGKKAQPLYKVTASVLFNGNTVDTAQKKIGIRTIELNRERDQWGKNFQFVLNGVPLFIKGSNYIPPDSFITRFDDGKLNALLDSVQFANMNMLRIWGGGYYESDAFYDACDERGILLWQDFQFACQAYPFFRDDFLANVKKEVAYNVKRLSDHPSLALWCGNNEIEDMHMGWVHMTKYVDWTEKFFYHILEPELRKYDASTPYTQGSPIGVSHNKGICSDNVGDTHLWSVWHGLRPMNYCRQRMTRFCSEFGFESLPDMNAIRQFAQKRDYSLNSSVFKAHQKCANGNDKMIYYIASRFNLPKKFSDYVYLSQVMQLECIADATEHWRRNKGRCNGSMYWQLNDCWGVCSWSSLDYYGNYKALQYGAKHFNAPLSISLEDTKDYVKIHLLNDLRESRNVKVEYELFDFSVGTLESKCREICINPVENTVVFDLSMKEIRESCNLKSTGLAVKLIENGLVVQQKVLLFDKEKNLNLPKAKLKTKIFVENNQLRLEIKTDKFARLVKAESNKSAQPFSDNFFDLLPNETKTITIAQDGALSLKELAESITVYSVSDIAFDKNKLKTALKKCKVYLSPVNIGNAVYHSRTAADVELD